MKKRIFIAALAGLFATGMQAQKTFKERKVLFIGIDGVRTDALQAANTPHMDSLMQYGISTFDSWHLGITSSGPSWSSMLTGVWEPKHGVTNNGYGGADFANYPYFSARVKQADPNLKAVQIITWNPMDDAPKNTGGYVTDANWNLSIDAGSYGQGLVTAAAKIQLLDPDLDILFIHYDECDGAGHGTGFTTTSPTYMNAIQQVDVEIGEVLDALKKRSNYANEDWLILSTTDHGGQGFGHGGNSNNERHIWWYASCPTLPSQVLMGVDPGSYQMSSNPVDTSILSVTPVLTDIAVTALDWILPFNKISDFPAWNLDGKSWIPDSLSLVDTTTIGMSEQILNASIAIYPNPANDHVTLSRSVNVSGSLSVSLIDITGKQLIRFNMTEPKQTIDVSKFTSGIYMLRFQKGKAVITKKIIIQ